MTSRSVRHVTALGALCLLATLLFTVRTPDATPGWAEQEQARWSRQLEHSAPGDWMYQKASEKLERLRADREDEPGFDHPDEYMRYLQLMKTPSDRELPEYEPGYQIRELDQARLARRVPPPALPWVSRGPGNVAGRSRAIVIDPADPTGDSWLIAAVGGGVWKTVDAGANWTNLMPDVPITQVQSLAVAQSNPQVLYAGTGESYWNIDTLNGNGMYKSVDGGATWTQLASTLDDYRFNNVSRIIVDPNDPDLVLASTTVGTTKVSLQPTSHIFRSTDGGTNWTEVHQETGTNSIDGPRILQLLADPNNFDIQYATVFGAGVLKSTDRGLTWNYVNNGITDFGTTVASAGRFEMAISPINSNYLFLSGSGAIGTTTVSRLWHSIDGGANWVGGSETTNSSNWLGAQGWYDNTIICSPVDARVVYVGGIRLWRLTLGALGSVGYSSLQFNTGDVHVDHHGLQIVEPQGGGWYILNTNDGGVGVSSSGDTGWTAPIDGLVTTQFYGVDKRPGASAYVGGMQDNGTWRSPVGSAANDPWTFQIGGDGYETSWHFDDPDKIIGGYQYNGFLRSLDGGMTWSSAVSGLADTGGGNAPFLTKIGKSNARPNHLFAVGASGVWRSINFGGTWVQMLLTGGNWGTLSSFHDVRVSEADPDVVWAGARMDGSGDIYVSTDGGLTFDPVVQYPTVTMGRISGMAAHPTEPGTAFLLFSYAQRPKVLKTVDYGQTWADISGFEANPTSANGFPDVAVYDLIVFPNDPNRIWVGSEIGLVESLDGGATWALAENGLPSVGIWYLVVEEDQVVVATHGRGVWSVQIPELTQGQFFNPLFEAFSQVPNGALRYQAVLRSAADSTQVLMSGSVIQTLGPNTEFQAIQLDYPVGSEGLRLGQLASYKDGVAHYSVGRQAYAYLINDPVPNYSNTLDTGDDFILDAGFSIAQPAGFSDPALHSTHFYPNGINITAVLRQPIVIGNSTTLSFDEVVLVEPGDPGSVYGDYAFWDFVVVEASSDGIHWVPLADGYDSREDPAWEAAFNASQFGSSSLFRNRQILLNDTFALRDEVFLRFRMFTDDFVNGWGWAIDNIEVDTPSPTASPVARRYALTQNMPNPFNPMTEISFELPERIPVRLQVFDLRGRLVRTLVDGPREAGVQRVTWDGRDARGARVASGVYLYRIQAGDWVDQRKMTLVK